MTGTPDAAVRPDYDVIVVGFGPVGQTLSILLAQAGHRVAAVERWEAVYRKPRAVAVDSEGSRVLAAAGISDRFDELGGPITAFTLENTAGQTLLELPFFERGPSGWPSSTSIHQPTLEQLLVDRAASLPNLTVLRSTEAVQLTQTADGVEVVVTGPLLKHKRLTSCYAIGCDGANSFVRQRMDTTLTDLGFFFDWLIVDVLLHDPSTWTSVGLQMCDPARPTTLVPGGPGRRRWEFMRMPTDTLEELDTDETAWALLAPFGVTPQSGTLEKRAVYTFQARWADRWRDGRLLLAGDASHLMPPFAGQGLCSGLRDAANLAWKLDLVLREVADPQLLDTYTSERSAHVSHAIMMSVELGRMICAIDPDVVAGRDAYLLANGPDPRTALPPVPPARLGLGALQTGIDATLPDGVGLPAVQGRVRTPEGRTGLLDDVYGVGFQLLVDASRMTDLTDLPEADVLHLLGAAVVPLVPAGGDGVQDLDDVLLPHLRATGHAAQVVRPDGYVFGGVPDEAGLPALLAELAAALHVAVPVVTTAG